MADHVTVELWTDGSGLATGGPGGWAYVLRAVNDAGEVVRDLEGSGGITEATNQRAELTAVIEGLRAVRHPTALTVFTDSEYVANGYLEQWVGRWLRNGWLNRYGDPVSNQDLWRSLDSDVRRHTVSWVLVKGHARTYLCHRCQWTGDTPKRLTPKGRKAWCPRCDMPVTAGHKHPLNARCDELAGIARRSLLEAKVPV